jgi:hypothetical protein
MYLLHESGLPLGALGPSAAQVSLAQYFLLSPNFTERNGEALQALV